MTKASPESFRDSLAPAGLLIGAVLLAWLPMLGATVLVADDHPYLKVSQAGLGAYFNALGFWRMLGQHLPLQLYLLSPFAPPAVALLTHLLSTLLLFHLARRLLGGTYLPLALALAFGVLPVAYQSMLWLIAYNYVIATVLFLAVFCLLLRGASGFGPAVAVFFLSLGCALSNEGLILALAFSGAFAWRRSRVLALLPGAAVAAWFVLYRLKDISSYKSVAFNPGTVLSTYWYQYSQFDVFLAWRSAEARSMLFYHWNAALVACLLVCGVAIALAGSRLERKAAIPPPAWPTGLTLGAMLVGVSSIFAMAGGYSFDSRKKYLLLPLMLLAAGWLWRKSGLALPRWCAGASLVLLLAVGAGTSWLMIGVWKHESLVYSHLADLLARERIAVVALRREPDIHRSWPTFERSLGFRFDDEWVLSLATEAQGAPLVRISPVAPVRADFDPVAEQWHLTAVSTPP